MVRGRRCLWECHLRGTVFNLPFQMARSISPFSALSLVIGQAGGGAHDCASYARLPGVFVNLALCAYFLFSASSMRMWRYSSGSEIQHFPLQKLLKWHLK